MGFWSLTIGQKEYFAGGGGRVVTWCGSCLGTGHRSVLDDTGKIIPDGGRAIKCSMCNGKGKAWTSISGSKFSGDETWTRRVYSRPAGIFMCDLDSQQKPSKTIKRRPDLSGSGHQHSWRLTHTGADKTYPRAHYVCTGCGARKVSENF